MATMLCSCDGLISSLLGDDEDEENGDNIEIALDLETLYLPYEGGSVNIVYGSAEYEPTTFYEDGDQKWYSVGECQMLSTDELNFSEYDYGHFAQSITFSTNDTGSPRSSQVTYQNGNQTVTLPIIQASATETVGLSVSAKSINYEQIRSANSWIISDLDDIGYYNTLVDAIINSGQYLYITITNDCDVYMPNTELSNVVRFAATNATAIRTFFTGRNLKELYFPKVSEIESGVFFEPYNIEKITIATESSSIALGYGVFGAEENFTEAVWSDVELVTGENNGSTVNGKYWSVNLLGDSYSEQTTVTVGPFKSINGNTLSYGPFYLATLPTSISDIAGDVIEIIDENSDGPELDYSNLTTLLSTLSGEGYDQATGEMYSNGARYISIEIPNLTSINYSFSDNQYIKSVSMPNNERQIVSSMFEGCTALESVYSPKSGAVYESGFKNCSSLTSVDVSAAYYLYDDAFYGCSSLETLYLPNVTTINENVFANCSALNDLTLSTLVSRVYSYHTNMFGSSSSSISTESIALTIGEDDSNNIEITGLYFTAPYTNSTYDVQYGPFASINGNAYDEKTSGPFTLATIPSNGLLIEGDVWEITDATANYGTYNPLDEKGDFYNLTSALITADRDITITFTSLESIPSGAFELPDEFDSRYYDLSNLVEVSAPKAKTIGSRAFTSCTELEYLYTPEVTSIGSFALSHCYALKSLDLPVLTSIETYGLSNSGITSINCPELTTGSIYAFLGCDNLLSLDLPKLTEIPVYMFIGCSGMTSFSAESATYINYGAFCNCTSLKSVNLPEVTELKDATKSTTVTQYGVFENCSSLSEISLPKLETIGSSAFRACTSLTSIELNAVTSINSHAFYGSTSLKSVSMPLLKTTASYSFCGCESLSELYMPSLTIASQYSFSGCALESVSLPEATNFGSYVFHSNPLTSADLPKVTFVGTYAFINCIYLTDLTLATESTSLTINSNSFYNVILTNMDLTTGTLNGSTIEGNTLTTSGGEAFTFKSITTVK